MIREYTYSHDAPRIVLKGALKTLARTPPRPFAALLTMVPISFLFFFEKTKSIQLIKK